MAAKIEVFGAGDEFSVVVSEGASATSHVVRASKAELARLAPGAKPQRVLEAAFRFLLEREPKESILSRFEIGVISRYFPEFERELGSYL